MVATRGWIGWIRTIFSLRGPGVKKGPGELQHFLNNSRYRLVADISDSFRNGFEAFLPGFLQKWQVSTELTNKTDAWAVATLVLETTSTGLLIPIFVIHFAKTRPNLEGFRIGGFSLATAQRITPVAQSSKVVHSSPGWRFTPSTGVWRICARWTHQWWGPARHLNHLQHSPGFMVSLCGIPHDQSQPTDVNPHGFIPGIPQLSSRF